MLLNLLLNLMEEDTIILKVKNMIWKERDFWNKMDIR